METNKEELELEKKLKLKFGVRVRAMGKPGTYIYRNPKQGGSHPHWIVPDGKESVYGYRLNQLELIPNEKIEIIKTNTETTETTNKNIIEVYPDKFQGKIIEFPELSKRWSYIYLHGILEDISGFDCCNFIGIKPQLKGMYNVIIIWPDKKEKAILYFKPNEKNGQRGLIVYNNDVMGRQQAIDWFNN